MQTSAQNAGHTQSKFQKFASQLEQNSQAWTTAGTVLTVMGGAFIGADVAASKLGVEFNNLKQISGAAMKTLTGSTAEANAQMDKLNEVGSNSWLMRDTLLRAQQQMVGFGISTD